MDDTLIAINRFGLGARAGDRLPSDPRRWVLDQLDSYEPRPSDIAARPNSADASAAFMRYRAARRMTRGERRMEEAGAAAQDRSATPTNVRRYFRAAAEKYTDDVAARALAAIETATPFAERMVHFWSNHFAISVAKRQVTGFAGPYEFEAIRPHILGNFRDLLRASATHPAMLMYLDQVQSVGPGSRAAERARNRRGRERGLNENLAREIMELHTLGVDGGYSQADVTEFARALTGYSIDGIRLLRDARPLGNGSAFSLMIHEPGIRTIMGKRYPEDGASQALAILDDLAGHPATARHIAAKLARHFSADDPPPALIKRLERAFVESDGDLPTLYRALAEAPEVWAAPQTKFRSSWDWAIAALRAVGHDRITPRQFVRMQRELGQAPWGPASPAGFDDIASRWATPDALVKRIEVAEQLATRSRHRNVPELSRGLYGDTLNDATAQAISRAESPAQGLALMLAAPDMMRR